MTKEEKNLVGLKSSVYIFDNKFTLISMKSINGNISAHVRYSKDY